MRKVGERSPKTINLSVFEIPALLSHRSPNSLFRTPLSDRPHHSFSLYPDLLPNQPPCFEALEEYLASSNPNPSSNPCVIENATSKCCNIESLFGGDRETVMRILRLSQHRGGRRDNLTDIVKMASTLGYKYYDIGEGPYFLSFRDDKPFLPRGTDPFAMISTCSFGHQEDRQIFKSNYVASNCEHFRPAPTDRGICHTFNAPQAQDMLQSSEFLSTFLNVYEQDLQGDSKLYQAQPYSQDMGLTFYLDLQTLFRTYWGEFTKSFRGGFLLGVADPKVSMTIRTSLRSVSTGQHITFLLTPTVLSSSKSLRNLPIYQRNCLFEDEETDKLTVLQKYSHRGCIFECMSKQAREMCHCAPWDVPYPDGDGENTRMCNSYGYYCFDEIMKNASLQDRMCGHCLPDCNIVDYHISQTVVPLDIHTLCQTRQVAFTKKYGVKYYNPIQ